MGKYRKLSHSIYKCDYHIVWTPKYRYRVLEGAIRSHLIRDLHGLSKWKEVEIEELNVKKDHVHMMCSIPPKLSISNYMGIIKGKTAIKILQSYPQLRTRTYWGNHFWARGYFVDTVGINDDVIRRYVRYQEEEERKDENRRNTPPTLF